MFRRKKKEEAEPVSGAETAAAEASPDAIDAGEGSTSPIISGAPAAVDHAAVATAPPAGDALAAGGGKNLSSVSRARGNRVQKVGIVSSDKMQNTVVVRVDRLVLHQKYRRYVRRTSKFMAHDDLGSTTGDRVRIVETRPLSARKRWRVVEIVQKAAK
jgi:small subunit ribosomal protein S17